MVATLAAPQKIKFHSPDTRRFAYKLWEDMTPTEQAYLRERKPELIPLEGRGEAGRYADMIAYYHDRAQLCYRMTQDATATPARRGVAEANLYQYERAITNLREAEEIPEDTAVYFAAWPCELRTQVPPVLWPPTHTDAGPIIETLDHVVRLDDPIAIAWLRHLIRNPATISGEHLAERGEHEPKHPIVNPRTNQFVMWGDLEGYASYHESMIRRAPE